MHRKNRIAIQTFSYKARRSALESFDLSSEVFLLVLSLLFSLLGVVLLFLLVFVFLLLLLLLLPPGLLLLVGPRAGELVLIGVNPVGVVAGLGLLFGVFPLF